MKKILFTLFSILILTNVSFSQWNANYTAPEFGDDNNSSAKGKDVNKDGSGGCYVSGYVLHTATGNDIILIKYNSSGDTVWTRTYNGSANGDDQAIGSVVDASGNIFVTGYATITGRSTEIVVLKYNSSGSLLWSATYGGSNNNTEDRALGICVDASGNCYITGYTTDGGGKAAVITLKYNSGGSLQWAQREPGPNNLDGKGMGIAVDASSNVYVTGYTKTNAGGNDIFTVKYNSAGAKQWSQVYNGTVNGDDQAMGIAVDASSNVYVAGYVTVNVANSNTDCALLKYNSAGTLQWIKTNNGQGNGEDKALGIAVDPSDGCIYTTGHSKNPNNNNDYITLKYNSAGVQQWLATYNGSGNDDDQAFAVVLSRSNNMTQSVVVTGGSWGYNNNHDFATVSYSPSSGSQLSVATYSNTSTSDDQAIRICSDDINNRIFVTGSSLFNHDASASTSVISTQMIRSVNASELNTLNTIPSKFSLYQNYPNPFNPSTSIKFDITSNSDVKLVVYDIMGKVVAVLVNQNLNAGSYNMSFSMPDISSGIYFYELNAGENKEIKKMTLIK